MTWPAGVGRVVLSQVDSTNAEGFRIAAGLGGPVWILAGLQTKGRGRRARPWVSPPGNFYATLVMQPLEAAESVALRSFVAALALRDALVALTGLPQSVSLKWPNDVLLNGGKVAGILLESTGLGTAEPVLCVGIGVNLIAAPTPDMLESGALPPVSLLAETGKRITPDQMLESLAPAFAHWNRMLETQGFAAVRTGWLAHAARIGEVIRARTGTTTLHGVFETVDTRGNLILRTGEGPVAIPAAEVFF